MHILNTMAARNILLFLMVLCVTGYAQDTTRVERTIIYRPSGVSVSRVAGKWQAPKFVFDSLTFNGSSAVIMLNKDLNAGRQRTAPTAADRLWLIGAEPAGAINLDSFIVHPSLDKLTLYRTGSDTIKAASIMFLVQ